MKLSNGLVIMVLASAAFAQAPANKNTVAKQAASPTTVKTPAKPADLPKPTIPATSPAPTKPPVSAKHGVKPASRVAKKVTPAAPKPAVEKKPTQAAPVGEEPAAAATVAPEIKRGRDPFVSVIVERTGGISCAGSGKKCLIVDQVMLKGIVRSQAGPIAVVTSSSNKTYFLRENDPVYNGVVVKITPDSIVFRETVTDRLGKSTQREVVKKVNNSAV